MSESIVDKKLGQDILEEIVRKDLIEMAQHFRPQVTKNIVKGVVSNIPLPIPINPVSVVCTGYDIMKEIDFDKKMDGYIFIWTIKNWIMNKYKTIVSVTRKREDKWLETPS